MPKQRDIDADSEKRTLRERVSKLESLLESLLLQSGKAVEKECATTATRRAIDAGNAEEERSEVTRGAPLIAALEASEVRKSQPCLPIR